MRTESNNERGMNAKYRVGGREVELTWNGCTIPRSFHPAFEQMQRRAVGLNADAIWNERGMNVVSITFRERLVNYT